MISVLLAQGRVIVLWLIKLTLRLYQVSCQKGLITFHSSCVREWVSSFSKEKWEKNTFLYFLFAPFFDLRMLFSSVSIWPAFAHPLTLWPLQPKFLWNCPPRSPYVKPPPPAAWLWASGKRDLIAPHCIAAESRSGSWSCDSPSSFTRLLVQRGSSFLTMMLRLPYP